MDRDEEIADALAARWVGMGPTSPSAWAPQRMARFASAMDAMQQTLIRTCIRTPTLHRP